MPNWVYNEIIITGAPEKVEALKKQVGASTQIPSVEYVKNSDGGMVKKDGGYVTKPVTHSTESPVFSFWNIAQPTKDEYSSYADQGWYGWNIQHWGTKWNPSEVDVEDDTPGDWRIHFETAWSSPHEVLVKLSEQHPDVAIRNEWREEQGYGAHQEYSAGDHWVDKEWNIPASHQEYVDNVGEEDCPCISYGLEESEYPYEDCPRAEGSTHEAVRQLEKISELI
jgi:hypothetical protein